MNNWGNLNTTWTLDDFMESPLTLLGKKNISVVNLILGDILLVRDEVSVSTPSL